jgi:hypothetical protein
VEKKHVCWVICINYSHTILVMIKSVPSFLNIYFNLSHWENLIFIFLNLFRRHFFFLIDCEFRHIKIRKIIISWGLFIFSLDGHSSQRTIIFMIESQNDWIVINYSFGIYFKVSEEILWTL